MTRATDDGRAFSHWLGVELDEVTGGDDELPVSVGRVEPGSHLRTESGALRAGALLGLLDCVGGLTAGRAALPEWVVSTNLAQRVAALEVTGTLALTSRVLRVGRNAVVTAVEARDEGRHALVASGVLTSAILDFEGGAPMNGRPFRLRVPAGDAPDFAPLLGIGPVGSSTVELELVDAIRNPWRIVHGAAISLLVDVAATHVVQQLTGTVAVSADMVLHFVAPGRVGPVSATGRVIGERADGHVVRVDVHDRGADDRLMSVAVVTVRPG